VQLAGSFWVMFCLDFSPVWFVFFFLYVQIAFSFQLLAFSSQLLETKTLLLSSPPSTFYFVDCQDVLPIFPLLLFLRWPLPIAWSLFCQ
jgi:hypothetical protein